MITEATARKIALSMPEAVEGEHMDHPDFRVRKKIFATLWPRESRAVVFTDSSSHSDLIKAYPGCFSLNGWSEKYGALNVHLERVSDEQFRDLVINSWCRKAPKKLAQESFPHIT
jgi:hypothetical protein